MRRRDQAEVGVLGDNTTQELVYGLQDMTGMLKVVKGIVTGTSQKQRA